MRQVDSLHQWTRAGSPGGAGSALGSASSPCRPSTTRAAGASRPRTTTGRQRASVGAATDTLRLSTPLAAMALVLGLLALVAVPTRRRRAELLASLSLTLAAVPMWLAGDAILATLVGILGPVAIAIWALRWLDLQPLVAAVLGTVVVAPAIAYAVLRSTGKRHGSGS